MFDGRSNDRRGSELAIDVEWMTAFIHAPAIVLAAADEMRGLAEVLSVVAGPDRSGLFVDAQSPGIVQPVRPVLRPRIGDAHTWVVLRNGVSVSAVWLIGVIVQVAAE